MYFLGNIYQLLENYLLNHILSYQKYRFSLNHHNNNIHNFINHPSVYGVYNDSSKTWSDSHDEFAYDQFISTFADNRYNIKDYGKLIYDITRGLLYNVWGENGDTRVKQYLGMQ